VAAAAVLLLLAAAVEPALLAPGDPLAGELADRLRPPAPGHVFGTDELGRDVFTRVVHGTSASLLTATVAVALGVAIGCSLGLLGSLGGPIVDAAMMRVVDVLLAVPSLLLALALIAVLGPGPYNVAIAVGVASSAMFARIVRSDTFRILQRGYIAHAAIAGRRRAAIVLDHVLPNVLPPIVAIAVLQFAEAVLAVAALGFLGYGSRPPAPEWGALVAAGRDHLTTAPWLTAFPGLVIAGASLAFHVLARTAGRAAR